MLSIGPYHPELSGWIVHPASWRSISVDNIPVCRRTDLSGAANKTFVADVVPEGDGPGF